MIGDFEALGTVGVIDARNLHQLLVFEVRRVAPRAADVDDGFAPDNQSDLADQVARLDQSVADGRSLALRNPAIAAENPPRRDDPAVTGTH
jgi:hypothetical protein